MGNYNDAPEAAEADMRRISDGLSKLDDALALAEERAEAIEQEDPQNPEEEADVVQRMEAVQQEIEDLRQDRDSWEKELSASQEYWFGAE